MQQAKLSVLEEIAPTDTAEALFIEEEEAKRLFPGRFTPRDFHPAYPDQLHTFVGDCSAQEQVVVAVPAGDVRFTDNQIDGHYIIGVVGERVSADYLDYLEEMQISYIFAGADGHDDEAMRRRLAHDFGITRLSPYHSSHPAL